MKHIFEFLDEHLDEWFEEIAGKHEFESGMSREQAEQKALIETREIQKRRKVIDIQKEVNK